MELTKELAELLVFVDDGSGFPPETLVHIARKYPSLHLYEYNYERGWFTLESVNVFADSKEMARELMLKYFELSDDEELTIPEVKLEEFELVAE